MTQLPTGTPPVEPVAPVEPTPGSAEYNAQVAMTAQHNIPAKFRKPDGTVDEALLLASYKQLEQLQRGVTPDPTAGVPTPSPQEVLNGTAGNSASPASTTSPAPSTSGTVEEILSQEKAPESVINWGAVRSGTATESDVAAIQKLGVPDDFIKQFTADRQAAKTAAIKEVAESIGGEENLKATLTWAQKTLSESAWNDLRKAVSEGTQSKTLLIGLHAQYVASQPKESSLVVPAEGGLGIGTSVPQPYASKKEMFADMGELDSSGKEIYSYSPVKQKDVAFRIFITNGGNPDNFESLYKPATDY